MSDRLAVMNQGRIEQIGSPSDVYEHPATVFVADFLGVSNLMEADAAGGGSGECVVRVGEFQLRSSCGELGLRGAVKMIVRPERVQLLEHGSPRDNCLPGMVERSVYVGSILHVFVRLVNGTTIQSWIANTGQSDRMAAGTPVAVHLPSDALRILSSGEPSLGTSEAGGDPAGSVVAEV